jgi:hypothetical protein
MSKLVKRCNICGRALTKDEAVMGEVCSECIKIVGTARQSQVIPPKTGSNVQPVPPPEVKFVNPLEIEIKHMKEALYTDTQQKIIDVLDGMKNLLLYKNRKYGDSAINPKKVFYKGDSTNSILIRLDDKIGRVMSNPDDKPRVNDVADIIGYCTLLLISMNVTSEDLKKFMD